MESLNLCSERYSVEAEELFDSATRESLEQVIMARRSELQPKGRPIGERLFAEEPDEFVERIRDYWMATQQYEA
jgi:hypothetical protein